MNFVELRFLPFFVAVFCVTWALRGRRAQNAFLVAASLFFYGAATWWFAALLVGAALVDFAVAQAMAVWPHRKRLFLGLSLASNLGLLGTFKYADFFIGNVAAGLAWWGIPADLRTLGWILPIGISFYTFQTIGYVVDVYRGELRARTDLVDYLLFVSFFPQLVAGPIGRASRLLPQVENARVFRWSALRSGLSLMAWGGFKKVVVADSVAPYVDRVYTLVDPPGPLLWVATAAFMLQIFADFSGYTDMARGAARSLGFELAENFKEPFLAATTPEFWQRWHMSLSAWIRDYLLGPLVGDGVVSRARFAVATLIAFAVMGFWHGPRWNFVLFGLWNGLWVIAYGTLVRQIPARVTAIPGGRALAVGFHHGFVSLVGTMLFREVTVERIVGHLTRSPLHASLPEWVATAILATVVLAGAAPLLAHWAVKRWVRPRVSDAAWWPVETTGWAVAAVGMFVFARVTAQDFVYFQF
jgi:D-alanyl-lipoteichoic acid acyltransferase DltB (MBOAT superfamily)